MVSSVIRSKYQKLQEILRGTGGLLVAFSGGVDSTFLLKAAHDVLGKKVLAVIAKSETYPAEEGRAAAKFAKKLGVRSKTIKTSEFSDGNFISNPHDRCYHCKKELFSKLADLAKKEGIKFVADGSNITDLSDFRPGTKAAAEHHVMSPLKEAGFTKDEIREMSKELKLPTWNKPQLACLASRIPYGTRITKEILDKVSKGEKYIRSLGIGQVRVRHHGSTARIEVDKCDLPLLIECDAADKIDRKFKKLGYDFVTIDLGGYRTGSMNDVSGSI